MNTELIKIFGVAVSEPNESVDFANLNAKAVQKGYIVHPNACTRSVEKFINSINVDYNSTFYKTFEDVTSKSRLELFIDQIFHYASTYGTDFEGETYVPNSEYAKTQKFVFDKYKVIVAVSEKEIEGAVMLSVNNDHFIMLSDSGHVKYFGASYEGSSRVADWSDVLMTPKKDY